MALTRPALFANIKLAIEAINLLKYLIDSNQLDKLVNKTETDKDNKALEWARKSMLTLSNWVNVFKSSPNKLPETINELEKSKEVLWNYQVIPPDVRHGFWLRLAVKIIIDIFPKFREREGEVVIWVQTIYTFLKKKNK